MLFAIAKYQIFGAILIVLIVESFLLIYQTVFHLIIILIVKLIVVDVILLVGGLSECMGHLAAILLPSRLHPIELILLIILVLKIKIA